MTNSINLNALILTAKAVILAKRDLIDKMDMKGDLMVNETAADAFCVEGDGYYAQQAILMLLEGKTVMMWDVIPMTFDAATGKFDAQVLPSVSNQLKWSFQNYYWPELKTLIGLIYSTYQLVNAPLTIEYPIGVGGVPMVKTF